MGNPEFNRDLASAPRKDHAVLKQEQEPQHKTNKYWNTLGAASMYTIKYTHTYVCLTCLHVFYSNESIDTRMHMYRHVYICITLHMYTHIHTYKQTYIHTYTGIHACMCVCVHQLVYACDMCVRLSLGFEVSSRVSATHTSKESRTLGLEGTVRQKAQGSGLTA